MGVGKGLDYKGPRVRLDHTRGSQARPLLFLLLFSFFVYTGLRKQEALSGGEPAELMIQQSWKKEGCDEHSGGLNYEH